ncbi:hypothetical protein BASA81_010985 [Batrachochytrium salamandrivorans]|nr:hypothetical protein BASA81_010985 [Batrachochytrium salamandrivorans]
MLAWLLLLVAMAVAADPRALDTAEFNQQVQSQSSMLVMFHAPWELPELDFFLVDATQELALTLQFDVTSYPLVLLITSNHEVYEWVSSEGSLVDFAAQKFGRHWNVWAGPFGWLGKSKYLLGAGIQLALQWHDAATKGLSPWAKVAVSCAALAVMSLAVFGLAMCFDRLFLSPYPSTNAVAAAGKAKAG